MSACDITWVTVRLHRQLYCLDTAVVSEMTMLPPVVKLPMAPSWIRGATRIREDVVTVGDLRALLGMQPLTEESAELIRLLGEREQDHRNWLAELEASVHERRAFTLTTDPHACAFGRWFDTFKTESLILSNHLKRFDAPHQAIHQLGHEVARLVAGGRHDLALERIALGRGTLERLIEYFAEAKRLLAEANREILITLAGPSPRVGVVVDAIDRVGTIPVDTIEPLPGERSTPGAVTHIARGKDDVTMLLDAHYIEERLGRVSAA